MARRSRSRARQHVNPFFPTHAFMGYPNGHEQEPLVMHRRRDYAIFARKLDAILRPLLAERYALHEELTVLTEQGCTGRMSRVDCVLVTSFGVFVILGFHATGKVSWSTKANKIAIAHEPEFLETVDSPLWRATPAVHFLSALLADLQCPVEAIAIASNGACNLELGLPTAMLKRDELHHFLRQRYAQFIAVHRGVFNVGDISARIRAGCRHFEQAPVAAERDPALEREQRSLGSAPRH